MGKKRNPRSNQGPSPEAEASLPSRKTRVFISHAHGGPDQTLALALNRSLARAGHQVFIDTEIEVGADWGATVLDWLAASDFLVLLLSAHSVHSEMVRWCVRRPGSLTICERRKEHLGCSR